MNLQAALKSQYHAGLAMLGQAIEACPASLWTDASFTNQSWQIAYHTLFYTEFYLQPSERGFTPWEAHRPGHHRLGELPPDGGRLEPYTRDQVLACWRRCDALVDAAVDRLQLDSPESGFPWYPISKLEHQFVNLRHLQHHTGQLAERLRQASDAGLNWVGAAAPR